MFMFNEKRKKQLENTNKIFTLICNIHNKNDLEIISNLVNDN
jgi:hypothetical protein